MKTRQDIRKQKKNQQKRLSALLAILGLGALLLFTYFWSQPSQHSVKQPTETITSQSDSSSSSSESTKTEKVNWVKQDTPVKLPILMYHAIHDMAPEEAASANNIISPEVFNAQMQALSEAGYYTLTPEEAYKVLTENVLPDNKKVVWLTFDDSIWDFYSHAYPILTKYQMTATNNVITGLVQNEAAGSLTLPQILEMQAGGMTFQGHTVNHPSLADATIDTQLSELSESKTYLDTHLQQKTIAVAYPSGRYTPDTLAIAEELGYKLGVTTNNGLASLSDGLLSLNRVRVFPTTTPEMLLQEITP
ncbi:polysaccharide deacetylase family protein [Streptococcus merionis]|uniref:Xylanase/chitin deacetylase n=1 Tax=Streptococcus merionis TaxID=400065 RepID=A0A239SQI9_9STRE|nr:polysaccharide deacetylase family protein [Streptococcus merionis]SNU87741.1 xylanase/chitin deacetylase [Streptococcus merionis]